MKKLIFPIVAAVALWGCGDNAPTPPQPKPPKVDTPPAQKEVFAIYHGNTHAHTYYSGDVQDKSESNSPENHFALAAENGYDFYAITDHSQYAEFTDQAWAHIKQAADEATTARFVAMRGYEHSDNNGPGAKGHMNVYDSAGWLNALADGVDYPWFQRWLTERANTSLAVSMNHPGTDQYDTFACYQEGARERITMFETTNGTGDHYASWLVALSKGWMVAPVAGCDNHGWQGIARWAPRTGLAAKSLTYASLMEAMRARRTFATSDTNLEVIYYVNNFPMGSAFTIAEGELEFSIRVADPDTGREADRITKIEILGAEDRVVSSKTFSAHSAEWDVELQQGEPYYYIKVYNASRAGAIALAAPVWVKKVKR